MELIYTTRSSGFVAGSIYRNPTYFRGIEKEAKKVTIEGDFPDVAEAYRKAGVEVTVQAKGGKNTTQKTNDTDKTAEKTAAELKALLTEKGIEFKSNATKAELVKLLEEAEQADKANADNDADKNTGDGTGEGDEE